MGSKNLKAVAVRGTKGLKIADPKAFLALYNEFYSEFSEKGRAYAYGKTFHREGMSRMHLEGYAFLGGKHLLPEILPPSPTTEFMDKYVVSNTGCAFCPLQCHQNLSMPGVGNGGAMCVAWFGLVYGLMYNRSDYTLWWKRTVLCEKYGVDHLYVEMLGSWLMELYKNGIITSEDTDGIPMVKGSEEAITALIEKLAKAEGFGKLLTEGIVHAAQKLGRGSLDFADQIGNATRYLAPGIGTIFPHYLGPAAKYRPGDFEDGGPLQADGLSAALPFAEYLGISPREAGELIEEYCCQFSEKITGNRDTWKAENKYDKIQNIILKDREDSNCLGDIVGHCHYLSDWYGFTGLLYGCEEYAKWLSAATGTKYTAEQVREVAHRARMLMDSYRVLCANTIGEELVLSKQRVGQSVEEVEDQVFDVLPGGFKADKQRSEDFCHMRGYDTETGIPTREVLEKLGLKDVADKLSTVSTPTE